MLYDVFICHASEDKDDFVRPLATALQKEHIEVWYDEFSLSLGDSIRRSIDNGLRQSRFGIVVLSKAFFAKQWTQYELDGLTEMEIFGRDKVLLPVWHSVSYNDVIAYSPSLAGRKAALTSKGLDSVVAEVVNIIRPQGSPFVRARDLLIEWGITPPVITDEYWLDVVEASNRIPAYGAHIPEESTWGRWSFPLPSKEGGASERGERLAWSAMQMRWTASAEEHQITPLTEPARVWAFIEENPGLFETCEDFPRLVAEYAPQLTIPGFEGDLFKPIETAFQQSCDEAKASAVSNPEFGSLTTTDGNPPLCDEEWSIRHPSFGNYDPIFVAHAYFDGTMFGPTVSPYAAEEHLFWLLSTASSWLPKSIHEVLLEGLSSSITWVWTDSHASIVNPEVRNSMFNAIHESIEGGNEFLWTSNVERDLINRIANAIGALQLPDTVSEISTRFNGLDIPNKCIQAERTQRQRKASRANGNG